MPAIPPAATQRFTTGARWLDLLASVGSAYGPTPRERLVDAQGLREWLAAHGLSPRTPPSEADVDRARRLREALRALGLASLAGEVPPAGAVRQLRAAIEGDEIPYPRRHADGLRLNAPATAQVALAWLAREAVTDLTSERAEQLTACADEECGALYLDPTGRRRWCSAEVCGNRHRVRRSRARYR